MAGQLPTSHAVRIYLLREIYLEPSEHRQNAARFFSSTHINELSSNSLLSPWLPSETAHSWFSRFPSVLPSFKTPSELSIKLLQYSKRGVFFLAQSYQNFPHFHCKPIQQLKNQHFCVYVKQDLVLRNYFRPYFVSLWGHCIWQMESFVWCQFEGKLYCGKGIMVANQGWL